jgi:hypothetical protein
MVILGCILGMRLFLYGGMKYRFLQSECRIWKPIMCRAYAKVLVKRFHTYYWEALRKMVKRLSAVISVVLVLVLLSGCWAGQVNSGMTVTSDKGAGTKTISIDILKDHVKRPDGKGTVDDNSKYFPGGMKAVTDWGKKNVPAGFKVELKDSKDKWTYNITYTFKDIKDYNDKTKKLIGNEVWKTLSLKPAVLKVKAAKGGSNVTFTEDAAFLSASVNALMKKFYDEKTLYDAKGGKEQDPVTVDVIYNVNETKLKVGNSKEAKFVVGDKSNPLKIITQTGFIKAAAKKK